MDPSQTSYPPMKNLSTENITENVNLINSGCQNPRLKFLMERVVFHLHDFARETRLSMAEWQTAVKFLTECGQACTELRQEFILLFDVLGVSALVDAIDHPKRPGSTEGTVLGPFHTHDAQDKKNGEDIGNDPDGTPLIVACTLKDSKGQPIEGAVIDVWETDSHGLYDVQYKDRDGPHGRAVLHSDQAGKFWFKGIVPVSYPVPIDGPVGNLLRAMRRHPYRPAHVHFMMQKDGFDHFISALTVRGDPYESHDPVFGVKESLVIDIQEIKSEEEAKLYGVEVGTKLLTHNFVMESSDSAAALRAEQAQIAMGEHGWRVKFYDGLPVPEVD